MILVTANKPVYINIARPGVYATLHAKQDDINRAFTVVFNNDGETWPVPAGAVIAVWYHGASGMGNFIEGIIVSGNTATVPFIPQMLSVPGSGQLCLVISTEAGDQIGTWNIPYIVEEVPGWGSDGYTIYYTALSETLAQIQQDIADLKYFPIDITGISNDVGTVEMGQTIDEVTISWVLNKIPAVQTLDGAAVDVDLRSMTLTGLGITANRSFALAVTDERSATDSASTSITFLNGVYYGILDDDATIDSAAVLGLTRKLQGGRGITFTSTAAAGQRIAYAIPARYGTPVFAVGGFEGGFSMAQTFDFTNASGYTESYNVYLSDNAGLGETTVKVT